MDTLLLCTTNGKYHPMADRYVQFPVTLDDLEGHLSVAGHIRNATRLTVVRHFAQFQLTRHIVRSLSDS